ncbi:MAG: filamentous hemagglutinin N-terminal domain-containing protein [Magnetococcales bacterium]|nr:filamentous hemagglutinin N-terminal domain-containing protein [Magnetococcales bacterium]
MTGHSALSGAAGAVKFDGTLGGTTTAGDAVKTGSTFAIPQSQGVTQGRNLFHSFNKFDLTQGETAAFSGSNVNNVISRVTGGAPSSIDGTIKSEIPNANLWFVNPKGMLFGPNAKLDVTGSFHASSGDQVQFKDGGRFQANPSQQATPLVSADPVAFGFLGNQQIGTITVNGAQLTVPDKKNLSLVGGAVTVNNAVLTAKSGQIAIVGADSAGTVQVEEGAAATGFDKMADIALNRTQSRPSGTFDVEVSGATGKESGSVLVQGKAVSITGAGIGAINNGAQAGGVVAIKASNDITLDGGGLASNDGTINSNNNAAGDGGTVAITTPTAVTMKNVSKVRANSNGAGKGGTITVDAGSLTVNEPSTDWSGLQASAAAGSGKAGTVQVKTMGDVTLSGPGAVFRSNSFSDSTGDGGRIEVTSGGKLMLQDGGGIQALTEGAGKGGDMVLDVKGDITLSGADSYMSADAATGSTGAGGSIRITGGGMLKLQDGGRVQAATWGPGKGGDLVLDVKGDIMLSGFGSTMSADANSGSTGAGGSIQITGGGMLKLQDGGAIQAITRGPGKGGDIVLDVGSLVISDQRVNPAVGTHLSVQTLGAGDGGTLKIAAKGDITLSGATSGISSDAMTGSTGAGGSIQITSAGTLALRDGGRIQAMAGSSGKGGDMVLDVGSLVISEQRVNPAVGTYLSVETLGAGDSGTLKVASRGDITLSGAGSGMSADAATGSTGAGGSIQITGGEMLKLQDGGRIQAITRGPGKGGDLVLDIKGDITLSGAGSAMAVDANPGSTGAGGSIQITSDGKLMLQDGGRIRAIAWSSGKGGDLVLDVKGDITLFGGSTMNADAATGSTGVGGSIQITGGGMLKLQDGGRIQAGTWGPGKGGDIVLDVGSLVMSAHGATAPAGLFVDTLGSGDGGTLKVVSRGDVMLSGAGSVMSTSAHPGSTGAGGSIHITSGGKLTLQDGGIIAAVTEGSGKGGDIVLDVGSLVMSAHGATAPAGLFVDTLGSGDGGTLKVVSRGDVMLSGAGSVMSTSAHPGSTGAGGSIHITSGGKLTLQDGGIIAAATGGSGKGGDIVLDVGSLVISDQRVNPISSGAYLSLSLETLGTFLSVSTEGSGSGGTLKVSAKGDITLSGANSFISADAEADSTGAGGSIQITSGGMLKLQDGGLISANTASSGKGGDITIRTQQVELTGKSTISSNSTSTADKAGQAGSITVTATERLHMHDSEIASKSEQGGGGDIRVLVRDKIDLTDSAITTSVRGGDGGGGNIFIDPIYLILRRSRIEANAYEGAGGNIEINSQTLLRDIHSSVTASSALGLQGTVNINTPNTNVTDSLSSVPMQFVDISSLGQRSCSRRKRGSTGSSFMVKSKGGLPEQPGDYRSSWPQPRPLQKDDEAAGSITIPQAGGTYLAFNCTR